MIYIYIYIFTLNVRDGSNGLYAADACIVLTDTLVAPQWTGEPSQPELGAIQNAVCDKC